MSEKTRYSESELNEFREVIEKKLEQAQLELKEVQDQITHQGKFGSGDTDYKFKGLDDGSGTSEREYLAQMAQRQTKFIDHLRKALIRIENGTYGICRESGKLIAKERLLAVPHATLSIDAKKARDASKR
ncbi:MAG: TraR/DksA C4-type zinc finger protein [Saprospiraceae bacterium]|nr:TraR/DksA C4-type zinc finger protein [Saprospiraceae bacterium]